MKRSPDRSSSTLARFARLKFILVFGLVGFSLVALYGYPYSVDSVFAKRVILPYFLAYARAAGAVLALFDPTVTVSGIQIQGRFPLVIVRSCDAGEAMALLVAAVLAFPVTWPRRLLGLVAGTTAVFVANVVRICSLYFIGLRRPDLFDVAHHDVLPMLIIGASVFAFLVWARWAQGADHAIKSRS